MRKLIGTKDFYKMALMIALPLMIQNGITSFVNLLDNLMVGQVGTEAMTGVSIVNQLMFVFQITVFGGVSGAGIFTAQGFLSRFPVRGQSSPFIIVKHCSISGRFDYPPVSPLSGKMSELWGGSYWSGDRRRHFPGIYT